MSNYCLFVLLGSGVMILISTSACSPNNNTHINHGMRKFAESKANCYSLWQGILAEWHANGGGVKDSLQITRNQISNDRKSKFAEFVRNTWLKQQPDRESQVPKTWSWPISLAEFRRVAANTDYRSLDLPRECQVLDILDSQVWSSELARGPGIARRLMETPDNIPWRSPEAQQWTTYWLMVGMKKMEVSGKK